jgi:two-component system chemotaxis sensor kinase CheA
MLERRMSNIIDDKELMKAFYEEALNMLKEMRKDISILKKEPNPAILDRLFRYAHTIKSNSGSVGFDDLKEIAQALEKIFKEAGDEKTKIDVLFISLVSESVNACEKLLNKEKVTGHKDLLKRLSGLFHH